MKTFVCAVALTGASLSLGGCSTNPATGEKIFTLGISRDQEIQIGAAAAPEFTQQFGGEVPDQQLQQYVQNIGRKMAAETEAENPSLPWEFTLLNTDVINAFALPGGKVFFTRGLAEELTSEAQMAGVLGHEIGHVTARHGAQRIASQTVFSAGLEIGAAVVGAGGGRTAAAIGQYGIPAIRAGGSLVLLKYGRDEEMEADSLGMRYMNNVGYNPRGQLEVMQVLARVSGSQRGVEFFSTHPFPETRIERIQNELNSTYKDTANNPNYGEFKERYQREFLQRVKRLPPAPPPPKPEQQGLHRRWGPYELALDDPASWCALCADRSSAKGMLMAAALNSSR
jgi:predicted Zn-dependent protease